MPALTKTTGRIINGRVALCVTLYRSTEKGVLTTTYTPCHGTEHETIGQAMSHAVVKARTTTRA